MSTITIPPAPPKKTNRLGLDVSVYRGSKTTLCAGCGHNAISERIIDAFFELGIEPARVAKFSGIGCSSKSPAYFLSQSFAINAVHGRMPSVATGAILANRNWVLAVTATLPRLGLGNSFICCAETCRSFTSSKTTESMGSPRDNSQPRRTPDPSPRAGLPMTFRRLIPVRWLWI